MTLVKSKQRIADHGEVFTPVWLVDAMLDFVKYETMRIDSRFLEPACGSGNFLYVSLGLLKDPPPGPLAKCQSPPEYLPGLRLKRNSAVGIQMTLAGSQGEGARNQAGKQEVKGESGRLSSTQCIRKRRIAPDDAIRMLVPRAIIEHSEGHRVSPHNRDSWFSGNIERR